MSIKSDSRTRRLPSTSFRKARILRLSPKIAILLSQPRRPKRKERRKTRSPRRPSRKQRRVGHPTIGSRKRSTPLNVRWKLSPLRIGACRIRSLRQQRRLHRRIDNRLCNKIRTRRGYLSDRGQVNHARHEYEGIYLVVVSALAGLLSVRQKQTPPSPTINEHVV